MTLAPGTNARRRIPSIAKSPLLMAVNMSTEVPSTMQLMSGPTTGMKETVVETLATIHC